MELVLYAGSGAAPPSEPDLAALRAEFPGVGVSVREEAGEGLEFARWRSPDFDFWAFDREAESLAAEGRLLGLTGPAEELPRFAREVATRCQRLADRRNAASAGELFARALARHREAHDLALPLERANFVHSLDAWQWTLRLDPEASLAVQLAALFHDVERLGAGEREEPGEEYGPFQQERARRGAQRAGRWLSDVGLGAIHRRRVEELIAGHEEAGADWEESLLADADALSFFSLNSPGYADDFGPEAARRKVAWTLGRMSGRALRCLDGIYLRPDVARMLKEAAGSPAVPDSGIAAAGAEVEGARA